MKHLYLLAIIVIALCTSLPQKVCAQTLALKNNLLYDITGTLNLGGEIRCSDTYTFNLNVYYNPWESGDNSKKKLLLFQPEVRRWFNDAFMGSFVGVQAHYGLYNFGKSTPFTTVKEHRYQGTLVGFGATYGYQWILSSFWSLEASLSLGYMHLNYKKYYPDKDGLLINKSRTNYWGPTQVGISLVYFIQ